MADEHGVEAFEIGEDDELLQRGVVAEVALGARVGVAPFFRGLGFGDGGWDACFLDRVGVDAVVDFGELALEIPTELKAVVFVVLEALELLDEVKFELGAELGTEFEGDVLVGVGAAITSGARDQSFGSGQVDPFLCREEETVPAGIISNSLEFEGIKTWVIDTFPNTEEQNGVLVLEPLLNQGAGSVEVPHHVGERNIVTTRLSENADGCALSGEHVDNPWLPSALRH